MTLKDLRDLLLTIGPPVFHYFADKQKGNYIVYAEDSEGNPLNVDDQKEEQPIQGTIDYFTKTEFDPIVQTIQEKLNSAGIAWRLNSIQHEEATGYIHYEWVWEVDSLG